MPTQDDAHIHISVGVVARVEQLHAHEFLARLNWHSDCVYDAFSLRVKECGAMIRYSYASIPLNRILAIFAQHNARNGQLRRTAGTLRTHRTREIIFYRERRIHIRSMDTL